MDALPPDQEEREAATIPALFWERVRRSGNKVALRHKDYGIWNEVTWTEYGEQVRACAFGLINLGLQPGERVAILSEDRPEWFYADLGTQCSGGVAVGIYATNSAEQCRYIVEHSEARVWFVEDQEQFDKAMQVRDSLPELCWIVVFDPKGLRRVDDPMVLTFDALLEQGRSLEQVEPELLEQRMAAIDPDDLAILFYTSGTTGPPKGVMQSHRSFLEGVRPFRATFDWNQGDEVVVYMPLCHLGERTCSFLLGMVCGYTANFIETPDTLFRDLKEVSPTFFFGVPRTWEKFKARVEIGMEEATWVKRWSYKLSLKVGYHCCPYRLRGESPPLPLRLLHVLAEFSVLRKLRKRLGLERLQNAFVGAAPVAPEVVEFFWALGVPLRELYGQTETGITVMTPEGKVRLGKIGLPLPGVEFRTDEEQEILCRGPGLLQGYFKNPELTAEKLREGWFASGDQGYFDEEGYLVLDGRVKDMMITSLGRNVAPQNLENMLKASSYIMDAVLVGDGKPFLTALIVLDEETVSHYAQTHNIPFANLADLARKPEIVRLIDGEVQKVNRNWSDREQVRDFRILNWELSSEDEELTPTLKVRRFFLCQKYADLIEEMYRKAEA
ncbi:MAG: AMP-binding protein [Candidatus Latescibacteria bacterium]|nr:AMP-binding protein [Candidatus Latescibacterota bacterium]